jgi:hypothetical protein
MPAAGKTCGRSEKLLAAPGDHVGVVPEPRVAAEATLLAELPDRSLKQAGSTPRLLGCLDQTEPSRSTLRTCAPLVQSLRHLWSIPGDAALILLFAGNSFLTSAGEAVKPGSPLVDRPGMTVRSLGLLSLVATLAIAGWLFSQQAKQTGPTSDLARQAQSDANAAVASANFQAAVPELQAWFSEHGTYEGATLSPGFNVVLRRADASSYCLESGSGSAAQHLAGPGGAVEPGPCL